MGVTPLDPPSPRVIIEFAHGIPYPLPFMRDAGLALCCRSPSSLRFPSESRQILAYHSFQIIKRWYIDTPPMFNVTNIKDGSRFFRDTFPPIMSSVDLAEVVLNTYGALLLGSLTATFLSGMNTLQTVLYFRLYPKDSLLIKASVSLVWSFDIIHTAFIWAALWTYFIVNIGQVKAIDTIQTPELIPGTTVATTIVTLIVQLFYIHRIFTLSHKNVWISAPILVLAVARVVSAMATTVELFRAKTFSGFGASPVAWILSLGLVFAAATDVAIMTAMAILLRLNRQKSMSLNNVIDRLILYTLEMGSVTAITAVVSMIAWFTKPRTLIFLAFYLSLAKLYAISLMGSLNTRYNLRREHDSQNSQAWKLSRSARVPISQTSNPVVSTEVQLQQVHVDVTKSIEYEDKAARSF